MFGQQSWYNNASYNPYLNSSYQRGSTFESAPTRGLSDDQIAEERRRALLERRARRAQWLPDEAFDEGEDDDWGFGNYRRQESPYTELKRRQELAEQERRQEALKKLHAIEAMRRQEEQRRNEMLFRKQREEQAKLAQAQRRTSPIRGSGASQTIPGGPQADISIPIHVRRDSPSPVRGSPSSFQDTRASTEETEPTSRPESPKSQKPAHTLEEQNEAASRIQQQYHIHASVRALDQVASVFEKLKQTFVYPHTIDFQKPGSPGEHITVPACRPPSDFDKEPEETDETPMEVDGLECKLDYTSTNYALNSHLEALDKLLMRLDGVESWGQQSIRIKRRGVVKDIERETAKLERYWRQAWTDYIEKHPLQQPIAAEPTPVAEVTTNTHAMDTDDEASKAPEPSTTKSEPANQETDNTSEAESSGDDLANDLDGIDETDFEWF